MTGSSPDGSATSGASGRSAPRDSALAKVVVALAVVLGGGLDARASPDTARDMLLALDCVRFGVCEVGVPASRGGLEHGLTWIRALAVLERLGASVDALHAATLAFVPLSMGVLALSMRRHVGVRLGWLAALAYVALADVMVTRDTIWQPALLPLPVAVFVFFACESASRRSAWALAAAAISLGVAIDTHLIAIALVPALVVAAAADRGPFTATPLALGLVAATLFAISPDVADQNARAFLAGGLAPIAASAVVALVALTLATRSFWVGASPVARAGVTLVASACVPAALVLVGCGVFGVGFAAHYLLPALPGALAALVVAGRRCAKAALAWAPRIEPAASRATRVASPLLAAALAWTLVRPSGHGSLAPADAFSPGEDVAWTMQDAERVALELRAAGLSYDDVTRSVETPDPFDLLNAMAPFFPVDDAPVRAGEPAAPRDAWLVVRVAADRLPATPPASWRVVRLRHGRAAIVRRLAASIVTEDDEHCTRPDATSAWRCSRRDAREAATRHAYRARAYKAHPSGHVPVSVGPAGYDVEHRHVFAPRDDSPRAVLLVTRGPRLADWRVAVGLDGATGPFAAGEWVIPRAAGVVRTSAHVGAARGYVDRGWPPATIELGLDEPELLAAFGLGELSRGARR